MSSDQPDNPLEAAAAYVNQLLEEQQQQHEQQLQQQQLLQHVAPTQPQTAPNILNQLLDGVANQGAPQAAVLPPEQAKALSLRQSVADYLKVVQQQQQQQAQQEQQQGQDQQLLRQIQQQQTQQKMKQQLVELAARPAATYSLLANLQAVLVAQAQTRQLQAQPQGHPQAHPEAQPQAQLQAKPQAQPALPAVASPAHWAPLQQQGLAATLAAEQQKQLLGVQQQQHEQLLAAQQQQLLASAQLLTSIDPVMAAAAVAQRTVALAAGSRQQDEQPAAAHTMSLDQYHQATPIHSLTNHHPVAPPTLTSPSPQHHQISASTAPATFGPELQPVQRQWSSSAMEAPATLNFDNICNRARSNSVGSKTRPNRAHSGTVKILQAPAARPFTATSNKLSSERSAGTSTGFTGGSGGLPKLEAARLGAAAAVHHHCSCHGGVAASPTAALAVRPNRESPAPFIPELPLTTLLGWSLDQLETYVEELRGANQKVPRAVALLVDDARRREEKSRAKRLANRRSACALRARKKARMTELAEENACLRREASILSFLPDPVMAISMDGVITYCNMQVERVLCHGAGRLVGTNIEDVIVRSSRQNLRRMIRDLVIAERRALSSAAEDGMGDEDQGVLREVSMYSSERQFKVKAGRTLPDVGAQEDASNSSGSPLPVKDARRGRSKKMASDSVTATLLSLTSRNLSFGPLKELKSSKRKKATKLGKKSGEKRAKQARLLHKDDAVGESITANDTDTKLSSLTPGEIGRKRVLVPEIHETRPYSNYDSSLSNKKRKGSGSPSKGSGYRESNQSREESSDCPISSSAGPSRKKRGWMRPLASACNVRLIRDDLSTVWCELTSSIRTNPPNNAIDKLNDGSLSLPKEGNKKNCPNTSGADSNENVATSPGSGQEEAEVLLCFRLICEEEEVGEELHFAPVAKMDAKTGRNEGGSAVALSRDTRTPPTNGAQVPTNGALGSTISGKKRMKEAVSRGANVRDPTKAQAARDPQKKRKLGSEHEMRAGKNHSSSKRKKNSDDNAQKDEKSAVESMMRLAKSLS